MKKLLVIAVCAAGIISAQAQGLITFNVVQKVSDPTGNFVGSDTMGQLFAGPDASSLAPLGSPAASVGAGSWVVGELTVPGIPNGGTAFVKMQAWQGAATYAEATIKGESAIGQNTLGGGLQPGPNASIAAFQLIDGGGPVVPEPSTVALAILGAAGLFIRRRK
jgi:hypothetical protein